MILRPNRLYELTSGIELTFADIKCQYFIGQPPTNQFAAVPTVAEDQTQVLYAELGKVVCMVPVFA